jgi:fumarylpyruvate hydrolase
MRDVIDIGPRPALAIQEGGGGFPVRRVFCVGRNYVEHIKEMGNDVRDPPFFFAKSAEAVTSESNVAYPPLTRDLHHEVELVVAIGSMAEHVPPGEADRHIWGYAVGVDLTRRDLQSEAKKLARPWAMAKSWVGAAPTGPIRPAGRLARPDKGRIWLAVNGDIRQDGDLAQMIWSIQEIVATLSTYDRLLPGDLIFTGTPAGVGPLEPGDEVIAGIEGVGELGFKMTA